MKKQSFVLVVLLSLSLTTGLWAQEVRQYGKSRRITETNIVEAVDLENRLVTLRNPEGKKFTLLVDDTVKNLPQVEPGDEVTVEYEESVSVRVLNPGETASPDKAEVTLSTAEPGEKPAGLLKTKGSVTATIEAIDKSKPSVTLKGPEGDTVEVRVEHPERLESVKVGDRVQITAAEAMAVSVKKKE